MAEPGSANLEELGFEYAHISCCFSLEITNLWNLFWTFQKDGLFIAFHFLFWTGSNVLDLTPLLQPKLAIRIYQDIFKAFHKGKNGSIYGCSAVYLNHYCLKSIYTKNGLKIKISDLMKNKYVLCNSLTY